MSTFVIFTDLDLGAARNAVIAPLMRTVPKVVKEHVLLACTHQTPTGTIAAFVEVTVDGAGIFVMEAALSEDELIATIPGQVWRAPPKMSGARRLRPFCAVVTSMLLGYRWPSFTPAGLRRCLRRDGARVVKGGG